MLTLKQLLESDSLATIIAKLNQNFQTLSTSNGGPQGIRGAQGIPGLPGKMGPIGFTGAQGPTGTILGIIPFAATHVSSLTIGPSVDTLPPYGKVGPWPLSSYDWLLNYYGGGLTGIGGTGTTPDAGQIFIDHTNNGYWKYLTSPDIDGAGDSPLYETGNPYKNAADAGYSYPNLGDASMPPVPGEPGFYAGEGWYFYPAADTNSVGSGQVWIEDYTTYLKSTGTGSTGPYPQGPYTNNTTSPLTVANARLVSKYGSVWITSGNDATNNVGDGSLTTSEIGKWGLGPGAIDPQPGRYNSGVDRLLFKLSIDGLSYQSNITARGYTGPATMSSPTLSANEFPNSLTYPVDANGNPFPINPLNYWTKPQYEVTLDQYTPLLFLSHRNEGDTVNNGTYGTLGIYMFTDTETKYNPENSQPNSPYSYGTLNDNNVSKTLHLFSSRYAPDPMVSWTPTNSLDSAATLNFGELILDFRRIIASNQYVCSLPVDMKLSSDYRTVIGGLQYYDESNTSNTNKYNTYQGYVSAINGKAISGATGTYTWEYGLGDGVPYGTTGGTHDTSSGTAGMLTRNTWYGSSVLSNSQFLTTNPGDNNYVRVAGMMERGRRFQSSFASGGGVGTLGSYFLSELIFYTSQFKVIGKTPQGTITNADINPNTNQHNSLPSLYVSPFRNIGIGTFVGVTGGVDEGPLEPIAKFHVHAKKYSRDYDPTYVYTEGGTGTGLYSTLPTKVYSVAAFSGQIDNVNNQAVSDILLGNIVPTTKENVIPQNNIVNQLTGLNNFTNAIRTESWFTPGVNTMHLGSAPFLNANSIGKNGANFFHKEFQISLSPLNLFAPVSSIGTNANTGVGIHNLYPRTRLHIFGKNIYNEVEFGQELWTPGYTIAGGTVPSGLSGSYPFYGTAATNANSANQLAIDYIGSSYNYPVGIYEYQYYAFGATAGITSLGTYSPNAAVYPNRDSLSPTRHAVPYGGIFNANYAFPSSNTNAVFNNSYKHGGIANAFWDPQTYIGFNLYRDLSSASGGTSTGQNTAGDDSDNTVWVIGTQGATANGHGNNGGAAIISSSQGELGIITIPRGRDGGRPYEQWEQRGLGTRDVLNHMKIVFDKNGNIAIGNAAGWDLDAYPSLNWDMTTGYVNYLPSSATINPPVNALGSYASPLTTYGQVSYTGYTESSSVSNAAAINKQATNPEYIRLEVAAEKAWSRDGRLLQKTGFGYPPNATIVITGATLSNYIKTLALPVYITDIANWTIQTDNEGRIVSSVIILDTNGLPIFVWHSDPVSPSNFPAVVYPHPSEFNQSGPLYSLISGSSPGYVSPKGAIAAEWAGMDTYNGSNISTINAYPSALYFGLYYEVVVNLIQATDLRGSANMRLNNFVYAEGFGFSGNTQGGGSSTPQDSGNYTKSLVRQKRQESPKIILSFLEKTPTVSRTTTGSEPYLKVNTVIASAQNEAALREYWIPKADNTGGTFMVFTDHFGHKAKDTSFQNSPIKTIADVNGVGLTGLHIEEVVTQEFLAGYQNGIIYDVDTLTYTQAYVTAATSHVNNYLDTDDAESISKLPKDMYPGYVRYYNRSYNVPGTTTAFTSLQFGAYSPLAPELPSGATGVIKYNQPAGYTGSVTPGNTGSYSYKINVGTIRRNIDKYYSIYAPTTNYENGWNNPTVINNPATAIRMQRINEEFALIDFNITIAVDNPLISGSQDPRNYIDFCSPRFTQYLRFVYTPDEAFWDQSGYTETIAQNLFGNGMYLSNWSSYKNWYPGTAIVGDDVNNPNQTLEMCFASNYDGLNSTGKMPRTITSDWSPFFNDNSDFSPISVRTWNGNILEMLSYNAYSSGLWVEQAIGKRNSNRSLLSSPLRIYFNEITPISDDDQDSYMYSAFGSDLRILRGAYQLFNFTRSTNTAGTVSEPQVKQIAFVGYLGAMYALWGNGSFSRNKNTQWRLVPTTAYRTDASSDTLKVGNNNSFYLEVQLTDPILHTDVYLGAGYYTDDAGGDLSITVQPYKYLTVNGQAIVRYAETNNTSFE